MITKKEIQEIEDKVKKIKNRLDEVNNSCSILQKEEMESFESDRMYLKILEDKLKKLQD